LSIVDGKSILITGGTGSLGKAFCKYLLQHQNPKKVIVFSRDQHKQQDMEHELNDSRMRYHEGNVRDVERLRWSLTGVDLIVHAAADKIVDKCEKEPIEAIKTNIDGTKNVIEATRGLPIEKAIFISSDKALSPANLYGSTKMVGEKIWIDSNRMRPDHTHANIAPIFSCTRWGNIENSRGAVIPYFRKSIQDGNRILNLHDKRCTRFLVSYNNAISLLMQALGGPPGLVWVKKSPSVRIVDIIEALGGEAKETHLQPGEKIHEMMLSWEECSRAYENDDNIIIFPPHVFDTDIQYDIKGRVPRFTPYSSGDNVFLTIDELRKRMEAYD
jgi:UDP-N-acetylglucosamine 4,6-dehydratase